MYNRVYSCLRSNDQVEHLHTCTVGSLDCQPGGRRTKPWSQLQGTLCSSRKYPYSPTEGLVLHPYTPQDIPDWLHTFLFLFLLIPLPLGISNDLVWGSMSSFWNHTLTRSYRNWVVLCISFQLPSGGCWSWHLLVCGCASEHLACCINHQPKRCTLHHAATWTTGTNEEIKSHQVRVITSVENYVVTSPVH